MASGKRKRPADFGDSGQAAKRRREDFYTSAGGTSSAVDDKKPKVPEPNFRVGEEVMRKGERVTIIDIDRSLAPPAYTVQRKDGTEVNTEARHLRLESRTANRRDRSICRFRQR